jgi:hypothetical protein
MALWHSEESFMNIGSVLLGGAAIREAALGGSRVVGIRLGKKLAEKSTPASLFVLGRDAAMAKAPQRLSSGALPSAICGTRL